MNIYENELAGYFLTPLGDAKVEVATDLGREAMARLSEVLAEVLFDEAERSSEFVERSIVELEAPHAFNSILFKMGKADGKRMVVAFSFKDGFNETGLPLLGLIIAVATSTLAWASLPIALGVARTVWQKLVILRQPQDANAIALLEVFCRQARKKRNAQAAPAVSWDELAGATTLSSNDAANALKLLQSKQIFEIEKWGGQTDDLSNVGNLWRIRL